MLIFSILACASAVRMTMLETSAPVSDIYELIDKLSEEISAEHSQHESMYEQQQSNCKQEIQHRQAEINEAVWALQKAQTEYDFCEDQHTYLAISQQRSDSMAHSFEKLLELASEIRNLDLESNQESTQIHRDLLVLAVDFMESVDNPQIDALIGEIVTKLQMNQDKYQELQLKALKSLDKISRQIHHKKPKNLSEVSLKRSTECLNSFSSLISSLNESKARSGKLLKDAQELCKDWDLHYLTQKSNREGLLQSLKELNNLEVERVGDIKLTAKDRADMYKEEWDNNSNAYVFKGQDGFQHSK